MIDTRSHISVVLLTLLTMGASLSAQSDTNKAAVHEKLEAAFSAYTLPMTPVQLGELLNRVAFESPGWTLLGKPNGTNCPMPDGRLISCDILLYRATLRGWDVITDAGGTNSSISGPVGAGEDLKPMIDSGARTIEAPVDPGDPVPPPPPPPDQIKEILDRLNGIDQEFVALAEVVGEWSAQTAILVKTVEFQDVVIADLHKRLDTLATYIAEHQIPTGCTAKLFGIPLACRLMVEP